MAEGATNQMFHIHIQMFPLTCLSAVAAVAIPLVLFHIRIRAGWKTALLFLYALAVLWLTVGNRELQVILGLQQPDATPRVEFLPFWSYVRFDRADIRWQVYLNVFLFIPFGFLLPWSRATFRRLWKTVLVAAFLSILLEAAQAFLWVGLCETDDVIHNALGAAAGYGYWQLMRRIQARIRAART